MKTEEETLEKRFHKALWAISGSDDFVPRVEKGLKKAIHEAYNKGKIGTFKFIDDCTEVFIKEISGQVFCKLCGVEVCPTCGHVHFDTPEMICLDKWHRDKT
ncbi:hypothetical protein LCGC14_2957560 [marine sediment metagenome]|uniref:Uncharacterized protein n=1 Tax=marine sediment metagenome TaxID=412755 RepID=A0A0F9A4J9_9ZZZZ